MEILLNLFTLNGLKVLWAAAAASAQKNPMARDGGSTSVPIIIEHSNIYVHHQKCIERT